jgi:hypothetical protein
MAKFQFFSVHENGGKTSETVSENSVGDQDIGRPGWTLCSELQVKISQMLHCRARTGIFLNFLLRFR